MTQTFKHDFFLMAEFCEQQGPVPLLILPSSGNFDLNKFVVRILASDHTRKNDPRGMSGGWQSPEDTQVYLSDSSQGAHAYVHHMTLHDIQARGYVRPICLCYVTNDADKIMNNFEQLLLAFTIISHLMKYGNNYVFVSDILDSVTSLIKQMETNPNVLQEFNQSIQITSIEDPQDTPQKVYKDLTPEIVRAIAEDLKELKYRYRMFLTEESALPKHTSDALQGISFYCNNSSMTSTIPYQQSSGNSTLHLISQYLVHNGVSSGMLSK
jgi:hypothetical protein